MSETAGPLRSPASGGRGAATAAFFSAIPAFSAFSSIGTPDVYVPLPDDWVVGVADVVASTAAIAAGRYKAVNTAGASVISALSNALGTLDLPFVFAGDGASFAVAPDDAAIARIALAATVAWVGRELKLTLRGAVLPVAEVRRAGLDVRVARFAASPDATYAMFSGGGLGWAEAELKAGRLAAPTAPPDAHPDLAGLSCRFRDVRTKHGVILSMVVSPAVDPADPRFSTLVADILALSERAPDAGRPIAVFDPLFGVAPRTITMNSRLARRRLEGRVASWARAAWHATVAGVLLATGLSVRGFSPKRYMAEVVANTDFRKYDDRLMMTVDCDRAVADAVEARLRDAERSGIVRFGLHRQSAATVTCMVPSALAANHVHFVDGAAGGYAMAARGLKSSGALAEVKAL